MDNMPEQLSIEPSRSNSSVAIFDEAIEQIRQALQGLRFGTVQVVVQDGVVIQLERTERRRLRKSDRA
jgi:hypothetical protein